MCRGQSSAADGRGGDKDQSKNKFADGRGSLRDPTLVRGANHDFHLQSGFDSERLAILDCSRNGAN
jgi:hypothetical protein